MNRYTGSLSLPEHTDPGFCWSSNPDADNPYADSKRHYQQRHDIERNRPVHPTQERHGPRLLPRFIGWHARPALPARRGAGFGPQVGLADLDPAEGVQRPRVRAHRAHLTARGGGLHPAGGISCQEHD